MTHSDLVAYPKGFGRADSLHWFFQEILTLIDRYEPEKITMRASEARKASNALERRIEYEGLVFVAGAERGLKAVFKKVRSTIAKDLGLKGRARYLKKSLDTDVLEGYEGLREKQQEAALAAWSEL